ncbi:hypothetical protein [Caulobacter sp. UNC279MFTsu5.1]|uniref:hypothetical protein n=1 Tax=Caulobacter sp. UNC279MFTsu5.1 TaxID=1502775 RepID=UPI0008EA25DA|nr:hypothetical protein [Caulobacter sp. UNC279MFTsu5.1]SFK20027.1 hypothetical protein SAMN02799626_03669 [Caulobacter sp. UNC279MFTsu5.1]
MFVRIATAAAALALMSGAAMAQSTAPQTTTPQTMPGVPVNPDPTAAAPADQTLPPAPAATPPTDPMTSMTAPTGTATDTAGRVSSMPAEQQATLKAGDPNVTSNPPIADTPQNRKLYGAPLSNAGKRSAARGN